MSTTSAVFLASLASGEALAAAGGPDAFGYSFVDQADGAVYNYVDITATGTIVTMGDDFAGAIALGAPFEVYGVPLMDMVANTNGFLTDDPGSSGDLSNDCPLPVTPSTGAGFRVYALHDDLESTVYYQYFTEVEAAALGYAGETAGISVFQWSGNHFGGGPAVDFEVILFHDDFSMLDMIAADGEGGSGSTLGIQDSAAGIGLNYVCNTAMSVIPGVTAIRYDLGLPPDSNCCSPSAMAIPGCTNSACQSTVCGVDPFCCDTEWDMVCSDEAVLICPILCGAPPPITLNEIRTDQVGADNDEYFELAGPPGTPLTDVQLIVLGDSPTGEIEAVVDLTGNVIPPSGFFTVAEASFTIGPPPDLIGFLNFENTDTITHMLVGGLSAAVSDNLDGDADGLLDSSPWITVLDTVAMVHPASTDLPYGPNNPTGGAPSCAAGPTCQEVNDGIAVAQQIYRCPDGDGVWQIGNIDPAAMPLTDTPGGPNACGGPSCGDGMVDPGEDCDDAGESAACDANCTFVMCGDGTVNMTAGETCDDTGESATCDADCTAVACGDGVVNMTAGEACDDMGESAACDADCTLAMCGDSTVNATAGETCDDGGRSDMCDADCTAVTCGDGMVNMTAGEECDGDGMGMGGETATCDDDCTNAMCGDGLVNATAGEECDDGGESATCDDDCTAAACGDGTVNATAGEECDDGNTDDGDGCAADCTDEAPATTGDTTDTGVDTTDGMDTTDTGVDTTDGMDTTGGSGGATSMGPGPATVSAGNDDTSGGETDTDATTGAVPSDEGCNCTTAPGRDRGAPWSVLALFGLGAFSRRRRRR